MGRGTGVGIVGTLAICLSLLGLLLGPLRAGPYDVELTPSGLAVVSQGAYHAAPAGTGPLCLASPCPASTTIDLRVDGLPPVPVTARLQGPAGPSADLGELERAADGTQRLQWSVAQDHTDKTRLTLLVAGLEVHAYDVGPSATPRSLDGAGVARAELPPLQLHLDQIGAAEVSAVAKGRYEATVPEGWRLQARVLDGTRVTVLADFAPAPDGAELDARVERLRLAAQDQVVVVLLPGNGPGTSGHADPAFPLLAAPL